MPEQIRSVRKQGLLLNGDDILDPSLFKGDNGDAAIQGISDTSSGKEVWKVRVGGTGRGHVAESPAFTDQELLIYDAASDTLKSSGVSLTQWNQLVTDVLLTGPLFTQRVDGTVLSTATTVPDGLNKVGEVTLALPANCAWRWIRVEFATAVSYSAGDSNVVATQVRLGNDSGEAGGVWHKLNPLGFNPTDLPGDDSESAFWYSAAEGAPIAHQSEAALVVALYITPPGSLNFKRGGTLKVTGWYKPVSLPAAVVTDPNEIPLPGNFTPVNFQLRMPDATAASGASNLEAVDASFTFSSGTQTMINWGPAEAYNYALKVLYTLQKRNGGVSTIQINQARDWLTNIYLPNTALASQVVGFQDPWVFGNMARFPVGTGTIQAVHNLTQDTPPTGEYRRNFALQTLPYVAA